MTAMNLTPFVLGACSAVLIDENVAGFDVLVQPSVLDATPIVVFDDLFQGL